MENQKNEIDRLKLIERKYYEIKHSTTYKWTKLLDENFINASFKNKAKFLLYILKVGFRYLIFTPIKRFFYSKVKIRNDYIKKSFPDLNIACILDEFSYDLFKSEVNLFHVIPSNWKNVFENNKIDIFFMESIWSGYQNLWLGIRNQSKDSNNEIYKIIDYCKKKQIPTVFWNKEDPVYFDSYIAFSKHFNYIFTTDKNMIDNYIKEAGHKNVFSLPFSINPHIHNPINKEPLPRKDIIFAGTYYREHDERIKDYKIVLKPCLDYNIDIYSRQNQNNVDIQRKFPDEYKSAIKGSLSYSELSKKYKEYKLSVNVNSVKTSPTMFSRRVLESIASGVPVISSYSKGIENILGKDIVPMSSTEKDTKTLIDKYLNSDIERDKLMMNGMRKIFDEHTSTKRMVNILDKIGIKKNLKKPLITILLSTNKPKYADRIFENIRRQKYENLEVILILNTLKEDKSIFESRIKEGENIKVLQLEDKLTLGQCLNKAIEVSNGDYFAKFDDDDFYSPHYLIDQYHALLYSEADFVSKAKYMCYIENLDITALLSLSNHNEENQYTNRLVAGSTFVWKREISEKIKFGNKYRGSDSAFLKEVFKNNYKVYGTNRYGYLKWKSSSTEDHTWKISDNDIMEGSVYLFKGFDLSKVFI